MSNSNLSAGEKNVLLTFCSVAKHSADFWSNTYEDRFAIRSVCGDCIKKIKLKVIIADGLGAIVGIIGCLVAPSPATCIIAAVGVGGLMSYFTICSPNRCYSSCTWCI